MSLKLLLSIVYLIIQTKNGFGSYMGNEASLRQNIADLLEGKLKYSENNLPYENDELLDSTPKNQSEYDFIVIGAGTAGATIASRLSEIQDVTILLIEAGGKEYSIMDIPLIAPSFWSDNQVSWNYETESSDDYCLQAKDHKCTWIAGKVMGGGSTINMVLAVRGNRRDYDGWANETGDNSWSYQSMLKYLKKLEDFHGNSISEVRNECGPVKIILPESHPEISKTFIKAGEEMGYSEVDYNGPEQLGFSYTQATAFEGERWSSNRAYLRPAKSRQNLIVTQRSHVQKILIDRVTKSAYGVRYLKNGEIYEVKATKEIILSAGAINSPQILMLSGIGPEKHLRELNIDVIKDAPVGENLADHLVYNRRLTFSVNDSSTIQLPNILDPKDPSIKDYINYKNGPLTYAVNVNALAFVNVDNFTDLNPNVKISFYAGDFSVTKDFGAFNNAYKLVPMVLRPRSRGKILLRSSDPLDKPKIYPNYLSDPEDVRVFIEGIRFAMKIAETNALKKHGSEYQGGSSPCDTHGRGSNEYWECELRTYTSPIYHPVGTCQMGRENSSSAVVDSQLKVIGINGLRVADASIMPTVIAAHTNLPVIAIGEKVADLIKTEHALEQTFSCIKMNPLVTRESCRKKV